MLEDRDCLDIARHTVCQRWHATGSARRPCAQAGCRVDAERVFDPFGNGDTKAVVYRCDDYGQADGAASYSDLARTLTNAVGTVWQKLCKLQRRNLALVYLEPPRLGLRGDAEGHHQGGGVAGARRKKSEGAGDGTAIDAGLPQVDFGNRTL